MLLKPSSLRKTFLYFIQGPKFYGGGSPPATPTQTTQTVNQNSIPAELLPYVKNMLNKAEPLTQEAYKPYSTNAADYVAPFSPLQLQAQTGAANLQTPGQFAPASQMAGLSGLGSMTAGQNYQNQATDPNAVGAYMNPYLQQSLAPQLQLLNQQFGIQQAEQQGKATQAGAFGGSREALQSGLINQNQGLAQQKMISEGYNQAFNQAQNAQQFGANLGLQGMGQGIQAAGQLGALGTQQLGAQTSVLGTQSQFGGQQQAQQQQAINQAVLNYQNAQQYPYMQLGFMSDLLRGTPTGNVTQTQYQAQPGMASQLGGLAATGLGAYAAMKADGGVIEDKGYAKGGIVGYKDKGWVEESMMNKLEDLDKPHLQTIIQKNTSPVQTGLAKEVLATKLAKGGIVAFANTGQVDDEEKDKKKNKEVIGGIKPLDTKYNKMASMKEQALPVQVAGIIPVQAATLGPMSTEESLKNMAANQAQGIKPPLQTSAMSATPTVTTPFNIDEAMVNMQGDVEKARLEADKPLKELIAADRETREKELGPDTATAEYRKKIMEERANAPDEIRRQMGMRLMEFGANWASTPGAPLVAGMRALKEGLPGFMEDTKANKKAMKELDQSIYMLDHATRLENEGYIDRATAQKQRAQDAFIKIAPQVIDASVKKEQLMQQGEANRAQAEHYKATEANQAAQLAQQASQFAVTSTQPTTASMAADYMKNATLPKDQGGAGLSNAEAYASMQRMQHPSTSDSYVEKSLLANVKTYESSAAKAAESYANMPSEETKAALTVARAAADSAKLDSLNFRREKQGLPPLDNLPENAPPVPVPTAQNNGVKKGWSVTPVNK